jgi:hypothetical protein
MSAIDSALKPLSAAALGVAARREQLGHHLTRAALGGVDQGRQARRFVPVRVGARREQSVDDPNANLCSCRGLQLDGDGALPTDASGPTPP